MLVSESANYKMILTDHNPDNVLEIIEAHHKKWELVSISYHKGNLETKLITLRKR